MFENRAASAVTSGASRRGKKRWSREAGVAVETERTLSRYGSRCRRASGPPPPENTTEYGVYENATTANAWYFQRAIDIVSAFKAQVDLLDPSGGSLLDRTIIPFVTEASHCGHALDRLPAMIFGGRALGMRGGQFQNLEDSPRPHNDPWLTIAQAYFHT